MLKSTLYLFQRFLCLCVCSSCRKAASCPCSSFDTASELDVTRHQTMDRKFSINLYDAPSWQTSNDWTFFISDSSFLIRVLSVWARFLQVSNSTLRWSHGDDGCLDVFNNGFPYVHMHTCCSLSSLSRHTLCLLVSLVTVFPLICLTLHFYSFICVSALLFSVYQQDDLIKSLNVCFSLFLKDPDGASEAAGGGRNAGWNRGSSSDRDQWHLRQGTTLQQRSVLSMGVCVSEQI